MDREERRRTSWPRALVALVALLALLAVALAGCACPLPADRGGDAPATPQIMVRDLVYPVAVAADGAHVYWAALRDGRGRNDGAGILMRAALNGAGAEPVARDLQITGPVATDGVRVFWGSGYGLWSRELTGADPFQMLAPSGDRHLAVDPLALDADSVFFSVRSAAYDEGGLYVIPKRGGRPRRLTRHVITDLAALHVDGDFLYYCAGSELGRVAKTPAPKPGAGETLVQGIGGCGGMVVADGEAYWSDVSAGSLNRLSLSAGGDARTLALGLQAPLALALTRDRVYAVENGPPGRGQGRLVSVPRAGGAVRVHAEGLRDPASFVIAGGYAFWCEISAGIVRRFPVGP